MKYATNREILKKNKTYLKKENYLSFSLFCVRMWFQFLMYGMLTFFPYQTYHNESQTSHWAQPETPPV